MKTLFCDHLDFGVFLIRAIIILFFFGCRFTFDFLPPRRDNDVDVAGDFIQLGM